MTRFEGQRESAGGVCSFRSFALQYLAIVLRCNVLQPSVPLCYLTHETLEGCGSDLIPNEFSVAVEFGGGRRNGMLACHRYLRHGQ